MNRGDEDEFLLIGGLRDERRGITLLVGNKFVTIRLRGLRSREYGVHTHNVFEGRGLLLSWDFFFVNHWAFFPSTEVQKPIVDFSLAHPVVFHSSPGP